MIRTEGNPNISQSDLLSQEIEKFSQRAINGLDHCPALGRVRTDLVSENVIRRQTDDQQICRRSFPESLLQDHLSREFQFEIIRVRSRTYDFVEVVRALVETCGLAR